MGPGWFGRRLPAALLLGLVLLVTVALQPSSPGAMTAVRSSASAAGVRPPPTAPALAACPLHTSRPNWTTLPHPCPPFAAHVAGDRIQAPGCPGSAVWRSCRYLSEEQPLTVPVPAGDECFIVRCGKRHTILPRLVRNATRVHQQSPPRAHNTGRPLVSPLSCGPAPSVVSFMLDSVSWAHFRRTMAATWHAVEEGHRQNAWRAVAFCRFSVVGVSSWENQGAAYRHMNGTTVFEHFSAAGHVVSVSIAANDWQEQAKVVDLPPYPQRPHFVDHNFVMNRRYQDPVTHPALSGHCRGDKFYDELSLQHLSQTLAAYNGTPLAAFGYGEAGHHEEQAYLPHIDRLLAEALKEWHAKGYLRRAVVALWSDHGHMYSTWAKTPEGKLEHRNPFLILLVPPAVLQCHPDWAAALHQNQGQRATPYDLYATLAHLAAPWTPCATDTGGLPYGRSLLCPLPPTRPCAAMGIPPQFCRNPVALGLAQLGQFLGPITKLMAELSSNLTTLGVDADCEGVAVESVLQAHDFGHGLYAVLFATVAVESRRPALWNVYLQQDKLDSTRVQFSLLKRQTLYAPDEKACAAVREAGRIRIEYCLCRHLQYAGPSLGDLKRQLQRYASEREVEVKSELGHRDPALKRMMLEYWCQFKPWKLKPKDRKHCVRGHLV